MSKQRVLHDTFVIERTYPVPTARVFGAWADPAAKARWFTGPSEWQKEPHQLDFRVGGSERVSGGPPGGPAHTFECKYQDIVPGERIIYTYAMYVGEIRISVSLSTVLFEPVEGGTRLTYTEQGVYLSSGGDPIDDARRRERGTQELFDKLGTSISN